MSMIVIMVLGREQGDALAGVEHPNPGVGGLEPCHPGGFEGHARADEQMRRGQGRNLPRRGFKGLRALPGACQGGDMHMLSTHPFHEGLLRQDADEHLQRGRQSRQGPEQGQPQQGQPQRQRGSGDGFEFKNFSHLIALWPG